jgi:hypothetical protein
LKQAKNGPESRDVLSFRDIHAKYKTWFFSLSKTTLKKYAIFAGLIIVALPTLATLLSSFIPQILQVALAFPAGIGLFAYSLGLAFLYEEKYPERLRVKERFSFNQRIKWGVVCGVAALGVLISLGRFIPYAFGGVLVLALALAVYNLLQRTPDEIKLYEAGVVDPRDEADIRREEARLEKETRKGRKNKKEVDDE